MQCFKFNEEWKFEKSDSNSQLKAFQGEKGAIQVTLPYDAMIREKRTADCPAGAQSGFYPGEFIPMKKYFLSRRSGKHRI